jgi:hypothetical protein
MPPEPRGRRLPTTPLALALFELHKRLKFVPQVDELLAKPIQKLSLFFQSSLLLFV